MTDEYRTLEAEPAGRIDPQGVLSWVLTAATVAVTTPLTILLWNAVAGW